MSYSNKDARFRKKSVQLHIGLPVGRYFWVGNHDGFQMKSSVSKITKDRINFIREKDSLRGQKE